MDALACMNIFLEGGQECRNSLLIPFKEKWAVALVELAPTKPCFWDFTCLCHTLFSTKINDQLRPPNYTQPPCDL